ncbi:MAG: hypothetical protein JXB62_07545 [Pirellulales bacterium]|nr:hypothetical protein [Pirellulales bacterium]
MAIPKTTRRMSVRESELLRDRLRANQFRRDQVRRAALHRQDRRRNRIEGFEGLVVLLLVVGFFALIYWLAISDSVPAAY